MSFSNGSSSQQSEINVTPLIDVLLVLLIIFMVVLPAKQPGVKAEVPQPSRASSPAVDEPATIMLQVRSHAGAPTYSINEQPIAKEAILARLTDIFSRRQERVMFVQGDADLEFNSIAEVVSLGHQASVDNIGVLTPGMERR